jgi:hypothetical protein
MRSALTIMMLTAVAVVPLTASCSSSSPAPGSSSAPTAAAQPACDEATVTPVIAAALGTDESMRQLSGLDCLDGWAVVFPTIGPADGSSEGEIDITLVLKAQGGAWVNQDRSAVCGTSPTGDGSPAYPSDAQVPAGIWRAACQTN